MHSNLIKNTLIISFGKICTQFITFLLLPLYTNLLSTYEYGIIDLITTYVSLFVPVITLQLEMAAFRFLVDCRNNQNEQMKYITNIFDILIKLMIGIIFVYLVITFYLNYTYRFYLLALIVVTIVSNMFLQIARGFGDVIEFTIGSIISGSTTIIGNVILLYFLHLKVEGFLLSMIFANANCALYLFIKERIYLFYNPLAKDNNTKSKLLKYSIPLIPNSVIWWIINVSDRSIISFFLGLEANGVYAIANKFSNIFTSFFNIYNLSWTEQVIIYIDSEDVNTLLTQNVKNSLKLFFSLCTTILSVMFIIFPVMIDSSFDEAYIYIPLLMTGMFFSVWVSILGAIYIGLQLTKEVAKTSLYSGIINVAINLLLVKNLGLWASGVSTLLAFLVMAIYRMRDIQKYISIKFSVVFYIKMLFIYTFVCILYYINNPILNVINLTFNIILLIYVNRETLMKLKQICYKR